MFSTLSVILIVSVVLVLGYYIGRRNLFPIPFVDHRMTIVITSNSPVEWMIRIRALNDAGIKPHMMTLGKDLLRAFYPDGLVLNCVRSESLELMGKPSSAVVVTRRDPSREAMNLKQHLVGEIGVWTPDPDLTSRHLCLVTSSELGSMALGFRQHAFKMGRPKKWNWERACDAVTRWLQA